MTRLPKSIVICLFIVVVIVAFCVLATRARAGSEGYIPEPEMSGTSLPYVEPYSDIGNQQRALNWRAFGLKHRPVLIKLCRATGFRPLPAWYPPKSGYHSWRDYGNACKAWAMAVYRQEKALHYQITHPGGSGAARWLPVAYYVGWPRSQGANLERCIRLESGGNPRATNGTCHGLMQIHECHGVANVFDPAVNLRAGLRLWRAQGWGPWVTM